MKRNHLRGAVSAGGALALTAALMVVGPSAQAATRTGSWGCAGQFAYITATTSGRTEIRPPGSSYTYRYSSGATRTRQAFYVDEYGNRTIPRQGGGTWRVYGYYSVTYTHPYCSRAG